MISLFLLSPLSFQEHSNDGLTPCPVCNIGLVSTQLKPWIKYTSDAFLFSQSRSLKPHVPYDTNGERPSSSSSWQSSAPPRSIRCLSYAPRTQVRCQRVNYLWLLHSHLFNWVNLDPLFPFFALSLLLSSQTDDLKVLLTVRLRKIETNFPFQDGQSWFSNETNLQSE